MGNRAVITTEDKQIGVYLHWNGGRDSVEAFLTYCKLRGFRAPDNDHYGWARLCQVIGNYFGGDLSIGIDRYRKLDKDNGDNGVYIIKGWEIVDREFFNGQEQDCYNLKELVLEINRHQPYSEQMDEDDLIRELDSIVAQPITSKQIKAIHAVIGSLNWTDERYRNLLEDLFRVRSCKLLKENEAQVLIEILNKLKG